MKNKFMKVAGMFASFAFVAAMIGGGTASAWALHQPKAPASLEKLL